MSNFVSVSGIVLSIFQEKFHEQQACLNMCVTKYIY